METTITSTTEEKKSALTRREIEVMQHVATGQSSKAIAEELFVSKRTVDFHLANVFDKLGVKNRLQATNACRRMGVLAN